MPRLLIRGCLLIYNKTLARYEVVRMAGGGTAYVRLLRLPATASPVMRKRPAQPPLDVRRSAGKAGAAIGLDLTGHSPSHVSSSRGSPNSRRWPGRSSGHGGAHGYGSSGACPVPGQACRAGLRMTSI